MYWRGKRSLTAFPTLDSLLKHTFALGKAIHVHPPSGKAFAGLKVTLKSVKKTDILYFMQFVPAEFTTLYEEFRDWSTIDEGRRDGDFDGIEDD